MLPVLFTAFTFIAHPPAATQSTSRTARALSPPPCMLFGTLTGSQEQLQTAYEDSMPGFGRIRSGLNCLYPPRVVSSVLTRIGLKRWLKSAAITDAMLTAELHGAKLRPLAKVPMRDLAEVSWEETLLPTIPPPTTSRCLSELSWEERCLPPVGTAAHVPGRLSELSWEDRVLPTLVPAKLRQSELAKDELSWEDRCLPPLSTVGTVAHAQGRLSELSWEDRLLPTLVPAKRPQTDFGEDDWRAGGG